METYRDALSSASVVRVEPIYLFIVRKGLGFGEERGPLSVSWSRSSDPSRQKAGAWIQRTLRGEEYEVGSTVLDPCKDAPDFPEISLRTF